MDLLTEGTRTARVAHTCQDCRRRIEVGETYRRQVLRDSGDIWTWVSCAQCSVIAAWLHTHHAHLLSDTVLVDSVLGDLHQDLQVTPVFALLRAGYRHDGTLISTEMLTALLEEAATTR